MRGKATPRFVDEESFVDVIGDRMGFSEWRVGRCV